MRLEPASVEPAELQRWLDTFAATNPSMVRLLPLERLQASEIFLPTELCVYVLKCFGGHLCCSQPQHGEAGRTCSCGHEKALRLRVYISMQHAAQQATDQHCERKVPNVHRTIQVPLDVVMLYVVLQDPATRVMEVDLPADYPEGLDGLLSHQLLSFDI